MDRRAEGRTILLSDLAQVYENAGVPLSQPSLELIAAAYTANSATTDAFLKVCDYSM